MEIRRAEASSVQKGNLRADGQAVGRGRSKWEDGAEPRYACAVAWEPGGGGDQQSFAPWWGRILMGWSPDSGGPWVAEPGTEMVTWKVAFTGRWHL